MKKYRCVVFGLRGTLADIGGEPQVNSGDTRNTSKPYPMMPELFLELRHRKIKTAVLSNTPEGELQLELERLFPFFKFEMICGIRPGFPGKPDPSAVWEILTELDVSPRDTILVGNSEIDIRTALEADCHAIGAGWGYRDAETLRAAGAQRIILEPLELLEFL
jgi:phosphoglycolate phosphatase